MEILETMTFTKAVDGSTKVLGTYLYVEGSQMLRDRKKYLIKRGYLYDKATNRYEKHFKDGNIATPLFSEHRPALQGNATVLAGTEYQAGVVIL